MSLCVKQENLEEPEHHKGSPNTDRETIISSVAAIYNYFLYVNLLVLLTVQCFNQKLFTFYKLETSNFYACFMFSVISL